LRKVDNRGFRGQANFGERLRRDGLNYLLLPISSPFREEAEKILIKLMGCKFEPLDY